MASFICPFCVTTRFFISFAKYFQHIALYHQHEPHFKISCDLHSTCGVLYKTFAAFKSHVYRKHSLELHGKKVNNHFNDTTSNNQRDANETILDEELGNDTNDNDIFDDDYETFYNSTASFESIDCDESISDLFSILKKSYISFILELREEYLLPKCVMNIISTYIVTLIRHLNILLNKKAANVHTCRCLSSKTDSLNQNEMVIKFGDMQQTLDATREAIASISRNDYQFIKNCEKYFDYNAAEEIIVSTADDDFKRAYFIPIDKTLSAMLKSKSLVSEIQENIEQQRSNAEYDDDLMFSIRDAYYGNRLDHDSLLLQLYVDDIGLTNPLGSKRDMHKMSMMYFSLEDVPNKFRSKLDFIQLVAICESKVLKVNIIASS